MSGIEWFLSVIFVGLLIIAFLSFMGKEKLNVNGCCTGSGESLEKKVCENRHE